MSWSETTRKVESSLIPAIESFRDLQEEGVDFLATKNSLLLSYVIDLVAPSSSSSSELRLTEMKVALDKIRNLDSKLRYQIEKLLSSSSSFAAADPLAYRPDRQDEASESRGSENEEGKDRVDDDRSDDESTAESGATGGDNEMDEDISAARRTVALATKAATRKAANDSIYQPPRLAATPYTHDLVDRQLQMEKRQRRRARASEVAATLRSQLTEAPEMEDVRGGTGVPLQQQQRALVAQRQAEKTEYEEQAMVRLVTTRAERKERKRQLRHETSNLAAIADDLGNLVHLNCGVHKDEQSGEGHEKSERYSNGQRKRQLSNRDGKPAAKKRSMKSKNPFQAALYGEAKKKSNRR